MSVLSDSDIKKELENGALKIYPLDRSLISLACVDLRLGYEFRVFKHTGLTHIDTRSLPEEEFMETVKVKDDEPFTIHPGEMVLGITYEHVTIPSSLLARLDGRSSLGRIGILVHTTAGSIDPGWIGNITLEIANIAKFPVVLYPKMRICRLTFDMLSSPTTTPYTLRPGSKYVNQKGPDVSKIELDESYTERKLPTFSKK